jgi:hypothetical protein
MLAALIMDKKREENGTEWLMCVILNTGKAFRTNDKFKCLLGQFINPMILLENRK